MTIIDRYIVRAVLVMTGMVMGVMLVIAVVVTFIGEQGDVGQGHYTALSAFWYALLNLPQQAWDLMPIGVLIGALLGLGQLARGSELIVLRGSGVSVARLAGSVLIAGFMLVAVEIVLGELLAPPLLQAAKQEKAFERFSIASLGHGGAWVRDGHLILDVKGLSASGRFGGMLVFELSPQHRLVSIGHADYARAGPHGRWLLYGYRQSQFKADRVLASAQQQHTLATHVTAGFLNLVSALPQNLPARALWTVMQYDRANSLDARAYVFAFWSRIARTLAIVFAALLAIPFVLGSLRSAAQGSRMLIGLLLGLGFFFLQRMIESGTVVFHLNPVLLAWLPTALLAAVTLALLARAR